LAGNYPYFYTDINTPTGTFNHTAHLQYKDPWTGTLVGESGFRLIKKLGTNPWVPFASTVSTTDPLANVNTTINLTDFGYHTLGDVANNAAMGELTSPTAYFCSPST